MSDSLSDKQSDNMSDSMSDKQSDNMNDKKNDSMSYKLYTRRGDNGDTDIRGERINKNSKVIKLIGSIDSTSSDIAVLYENIKKDKTYTKDMAILFIIILNYFTYSILYLFISLLIYLIFNKIYIQRDEFVLKNLELILYNLYKINGYISGYVKAEEINTNLVSNLENSIEKIDINTKLTDFIVNIGCYNTALSSKIRTQVRETEIKLISYFNDRDEIEVEKNIKIYFNRLSSYFFYLERYFNLLEGKEILIKNLNN